MKSTCQNFWRAAQFNASALSLLASEMQVPGVDSEDSAGDNAGGTGATEGTGGTGQDKNPSGSGTDENQTGGGGDSSESGDNVNF